MTKSRADAFLAGSSADAGCKVREEATCGRTKWPQSLKCEGLKADSVAERGILRPFTLFGSSGSGAQLTRRGVQVAGRARLDNCRVPGHWHAPRIRKYRHSVRYLAVRAHESCRLQNRSHARFCKSLLGKGVNFRVATVTTSSTATYKLVVTVRVEKAAAHADTLGRRWNAEAQSDRNREEIVRQTGSKARVG